MPGWRWLPTGLRALDPIGAGDALRALAVPQELGIRRSDGRWLVRSTTGHMISDRFGDPVILLPRAAVIDALAARIPGGVLSLATEVTSVEPGGTAGAGKITAARVATSAGELEADLVVAADGIGSEVRTVLFPDHPGLRYAGFTTWRLLTGPVTGHSPDGGELGARHRLRRHAAVRRAGVLLRGCPRTPRCARRR